MDILFVTATRIGDAVLSTGLLSYLVERYPGARLTIAAGPAGGAVVRSRTRARPADRRRKAALGAALAAALCRRRCAPLGSRRRSAGLGAGLAVALRRAPGRRARAARASIGCVNSAASSASIRHPARGCGRRPFTNARRQRCFPPGRPLLAIGPAANWRGKQWRAERFAELALRLTASGGLLPGARVAVLAAEHERGQALPLLEALPASRLVDLVGRVDLLTAAAVLRRSVMFIGNDTGLMHIAAAAGTPTLGLFGPSPIEKYAPWGRRTAVVRTAEAPETMFGPGFNHLTTDTLMDSLTVEAAENAARRLWRQVESAAA